MTRFSTRGVSLGILVSAISASVLFTTLVVSQRYWLDDAFISFRYARNLHDGLGLVYNAGHRVEGYTNFLWTLAAFLSLRLGFEPIFFAQALSVAAQIVTLCLVYLLGDGLSRPSHRSVIAPIFLAAHVSFLAYPMTGMETTFFTMLTTLAVFAYHRELHKRGSLGALTLALILVTIALTRFDGFVLVLILLGYGLLWERDENTVTVMIITLIGIGGYNLWRLYYYPTILPNTFHAKIGFSSTQLLEGIGYIATFFAERGQYAALLAIAAFLLGSSSSTAKLAAWVSCAHLTYVAIVGGDWMPHFRFILPVLPLVLLLMQEGLWSVYDVTKSRIREHRPRRALAGVTLLLLFGFNLVPLYRGISFKELSADWFDTEDARIIGVHLHDALPADYVVAIEWAGIVPYYLRQPVLDTFGLNDRDIVTQDFPSSRFGRSISLDYLARRSPDIVIPCARTFESVEAASVSAEPGGSCNYRDFMSLASPRHGYGICIMKVGENAYWPSLIRTARDEEVALQSDLLDCIGGIH